MVSALVLLLPDPVLKQILDLMSLFVSINIAPFSSCAWPQPRSVKLMQRLQLASVSTEAHSGNLAFDRKHRTEEVGRHLWRHSSLLCSKPSLLQHISQCCVQSDFKYLQGWRLNKLSGQPVLVCLIIPTVQKFLIVWKWIFLSFCAYCFLSCHFEPLQSLHHPRGPLLCKLLGLLATHCCLCLNLKLLKKNHLIHNQS